MTYMRYLYLSLFVVFSLGLFSSFKQIDLSKHIDLIEIKKDQTLNEIFPIKDIIEIKISNLYGNYVLNGKDYIEIKSLIGNAKYQGGLHLKLGHVLLTITLKGKQSGGYIYVNDDLINFENGHNLKGEHFSGSFKLNKKINFDNFH